MIAQTTLKSSLSVAGCTQLPATDHSYWTSWDVGIVWHPRKYAFVLHRVVVNRWILNYLTDTAAKDYPNTSGMTRKNFWKVNHINIFIADDLTTKTHKIPFEVWNLPLIKTIFKFWYTIICFVGLMDVDVIFLITDPLKIWCENSIIQYFNGF